MQLITINPNYLQVKSGPFVIAKIIKNAKGTLDIDMLDQKFTADTVSLALDKIQRRIK